MYAIIYFFTQSFWLATIGSAVVVIIMLRFVAATLKKKDTAFSELAFCFLFIVRNLSSIQVRSQNIKTNANRIAYLWSRGFSVRILSTVYRCGLISYMTFPFTQPAIGNVENLWEVHWRRWFAGITLHRFYSAQLVLFSMSSGDSSLSSTTYLKCTLC